ncbi:MAG: lipase [Bacteroidales bacterium]|nr:lipase [Bacteroidales bacterium]
MKNFIVACVFILILVSCAESPVFVSPENELIEYTGRIDFSNPETPVFSYSGVSIRACFSGTTIAMIMSDDTGENYYNIILDGEVIDTVRIDTIKKTYEIASELRDTIHEVEIFKRTELTFGKTSFYGFVLDAGEALVQIQNKRTKLIEFIGNSITCGYGNEGENGESFGSSTENHYMTYAAITSRNFNARHLAVCRSGIGIYRNYNGLAEGNKDCMPNNYQRIFLYNEEPLFSFRETPNLVCINLGTNDFSTSGGDSALYVSNYLRFIDTLQAKYNKPDILCLLGPMISGETLPKVRSYIQFVADSANKNGLGRVSFFEMSAQTGELGIGIDYHPSVEQHRRNAEELTEYIKPLKGW